MFDFIISPENLPFAIALTIFIIIALIEGTGALFGVGISAALDALFPNIDTDINIETPDMDSSTLGKILSWFRIGKVPVLVLLIIFLVSFGIYGLLMQDLLLKIFGFMLPAFIAWILPFILAIPTVRYCGTGIARIIPQDQTSAVSSESFIGRIATITLGKASHKNPAQAKVKDSYGKSHYLMLEPDLKNESFDQGSKVLIVKKSGSLFYAIRNDNSNLI